MDKNHRRRIIVDPKLQYSLMTTLLVVFVLASAIFYITMSLALLEVHTTVETLQLPQEHRIFSDLQQIENSAMLTFAATFIGFAILVVWGGLYLARKIAGPIFALRRHLERVADGETVADLAFRNDDYFTALQTAFNRHMDAYRKQLPSNTSA
jgi:nitrogen fixation/metabolism regulation signal transduction histidine kinase